MQKTVHHLTQQLIGIRWGTLTSGLVDTIKVQNVELKYLATSFGQGSQITVIPHDPSTIGMIKNALCDSGFNAYIQSKTNININVPQPTREEKEKVIKHIKTLGEDAKISIRNIRKKARKAECDDEEVQSLTDEMIRQVEQVVNSKIQAM